MDQLERYQEELERRADVRATFSKTETVQPRSDIRAADYPVTIIGCIRGIDGWYRAGFDHAKNAVVPMERIEKISLQYIFRCSECWEHGWEGLRICHKTYLLRHLPEGRYGLPIRRGASELEIYRNIPRNQNNDETGENAGTNKNKLERVNTMSYTTIADMIVSSTIAAVPVLAFLAGLVYLYKTEA